MFHYLDSLYIIFISVSDDAVTANNLIHMK